MIKGSYDFSRIGLDGVTAYALWVHGWNAINPSTKREFFNKMNMMAISSGFPRPTN